MQPVVVGIAGGSGSGKSTLVEALIVAAPTAATTVSFDSYYHPLDHLPLHERRQVNFDHPDSLDAERFAADLRSLRSGAGVATPLYSFEEFTRSDDVQLAEPQPLVVVDGILLLAFAELRALLDVKVFVDVPESVRTARRLARDVGERGRTRKFALDQLRRTVHPMHDEHVLPSMAHADLVVDGTADTGRSTALILERVSAAAPVG